MARLIPKKRTGEYLKACIEALVEKGGSVKSRDVTKEVGAKLSGFSDTETELYDNGKPRWEITFKFLTVGLVKGGYLRKHRGVWYLTDKGKGLVGLEALELVNLAEDSYDNWSDESESQDEYEDEEESDESDFAVMEDIDISEPPPTNLRIKPTPMTFDDLLKGVEKSLIQIPPFQRNFVWSPREIVDLLDSIYRGYPIGSFIFWKTKRRLPRHREIGGLKLNEIPPGSLIDYVLDGQQRITSLYAAIRKAKIEDKQYSFYFDLSQDKQRFLYTLTGSRQDKKSQGDIFHLSLEKLFVEGPEYRKFTRDYPEKYKEILDDLYFRFKEYSFSVIYVQDEEEEQRSENETVVIKRIVNIFSRINEKGKKLTMVAKMVARCWGENFDLRKKFDELYTENEELLDIREEVILQACSVILNDKKSHTRNILNDTDIKELDEKWDDIMKAFKISLDFVKDKVGVKNLKFLPFDALLVPLTYFHYQTPNPSTIQAENLFRWFWAASLSNRFSATVEAKFEEDCEAFDKLLGGEEVDFNYPIDWITFKSRVIEQKYSLRNAFSKTMFSLYAYNGPKSFKDNRDIDLVNSFSRYSEPNMHHFFPRKYLERADHPQRRYKNSVVNIAFAPAPSNREISDKPPSEYIKKLEHANPGIKDALKSHLIGDFEEFGITTDNFEQFLEKRAETIENKFRRLLGLRSKTEEQFESEPETPIDFLEVNLRNLIDQVLKEGTGEDYWDASIPLDIKTSVNKKIHGHLKLHPYNEWRYNDPRARLDFLNVMDYLKIILTNWDSFKKYFSSKKEVEKHFQALNNYRNFVKHHRQGDEVERRTGEAAVLWFEKIFDSLKKKK